MRLIDADALHAAMYHEAFETDSDLQRWDAGCWIRWRMFEKMLDAAPTIAEDDGWRDVKTDPPKENCDCIVVADGESELAVCRINNDGSFTFMDTEIMELPDEIKGVTHWMPKPEPPKEDV